MPKRYRYLALIYKLYPAWPFEEYRYASHLIEKYGCRTVVDVGCGPGNLARFLPGAVEKYVGIDIHRIFRRAGGRAAFVEANGASPPLRGPFDCAVFVNSLFYIGVGALKEYSKVARTLIVIDIDRRYPHVRLFDFLEGSIRLSPEELAGRISEMGLEVVERDGGVTFYLVARVSRG